MKTIHVAILSMALLATANSNAFAIGYTFTDLGTLGGTLSQALAINNSGQIVGSAWTTGGLSSHATVWNGTTATDLTPGIAGNSSVASGISNSGLVAGAMAVDINWLTWGWRATVWNGTTSTVLGTLPDTVHSEAWGINNSGQVIGQSQVNPYSGEFHATVWNGSTPTDLGRNSYVRDINESGQIAGSMLFSDGKGGFVNHATIWNGTTSIDLGTLGGAYSGALAINDLGQVVGSSSTANGENYAFLYSEGKMLDLGTLGGTYSHAVAINDKGQVVGMSRKDNSLSSYAFFFTDGTMLDLNTLANAAANGWTITDVRGINDSGQIVGSAKNSLGQTHAFLLTPESASPVPVPGTAVLLGSALAGLTRLRRKKTAAA